ncbi:AraC family transcriptional regulator [uncultured Psychroserpens sp.]|uniref:helix-turn-helix domain-containing protein n=1 Tax=uncultured Psychroserpens sp. TaxID=255436 RepID=UPI00261BD59D|nr:helix-turn-helix domain-containing protein [uncultured Psychroserpens sp.]
MQIEFSFSSVVDILSIATAFMLGLLFLTIKSKNKRANIFLCLFLWSLTVEVYNAFSHNFTETITPVLETTLFTILFLILYVNLTINNTFKKWFLVLFIPGILLNIVFFFNNEMDDFRPLEYLFNIGLLLYILKILKQHKNHVTNYYSDLEHKTLSWIKAIVFVFLGFHVFWITEDIIAFQNEDIATHFALLSSILTLFMIYWIGYNGFSQSEIFKNKLFTTTEEIIQVKNEIAPSSDETNDKFEKLKEKIISDKLFTNTELNLRSLSESLGVKEKELSSLINTHAKTNFYQFINHFRVDEFKRLLQSPKAKQLSILGLAQEAGFKSKSTFYTAFKSIEGMTPKAFELSLKMSE